MKNVIKHLPQTRYNVLPVKLGCQSVSPSVGRSGREGKSTKEKVRKREPNSRGRNWFNTLTAGHVFIAAPAKAHGRKSSGKVLQRQLCGDQEYAHTHLYRQTKGQPATCLMALFYLISHQWHHSYTVYFGLYVGLPPVAQADLDRLRGQTSHCEALFAYSKYPKYIFTLFIRGQDLSNMFTTPQLNYLVCQAAHRVLALKDVYIRPWRWMC